GVYAAFWLSNYQQHRQDAERRERGTRSRGVSARAGCRRHAAAASVRFHDRLQPGRLRHAASIRRHPAARVGDPHRAAQRRIGYPLGTEPHGALSKIKRRTDRAESRPGHFVLLRCRHKEIAETIRDVSRSPASNREIRLMTSNESIPSCSNESKPNDSANNMISAIRRFASLLLIIAASDASAADYPAPTEGDYTIRDFRFASGETLPELRLHYRTLGKLEKDAQGKTTNAV